MSTHFAMGAINKITKQYESPAHGCKGNHYMCPSCERDVILRMGKVRREHYAHKYKSGEEGCVYYKHPSESQLHKDAKMKLQRLLNLKVALVFQRECNVLQRLVYNFT